MAIRFNKIGLRRDRNFSDIRNPELALNNLLNNLVTSEGESFVSQDLDVIRDIRTTTIVNRDFRNITGSALRVTNPNNFQLEVYKPLVKLKNRFDNSKFTVGEPFLFGGDGLTLRYYEGNQIFSDSENVESIFTGAERAKEIFWERGIFDFQSKIRDDFQDIYGGIRFDGYFKPTESGNWTFNFRSTGFFTLEVGENESNLILRRRKSEYEYKFRVNSASSGSDTITLKDPSKAIMHLFEGDVLINQSIDQFNDEDNRVLIESVNQSNGSIRISFPLDEPIVDNTEFTFRFLIGEEGGRTRFTLSNLEEFKNYKIRIRYWIPDIDAINQNPRVNKSLVSTVNYPSDPDGSYLNYRWLYSEDYRLNPQESSIDFGDFRKFYNSRLNVGGGTVGGNVFSEYQKLLSTSKLSISYNPPKNSEQIQKTIGFSGMSTSSNKLTINNTDGIEVGNYVFMALEILNPGETSALQEGTRVERIAINNSIFLTELPLKDVSTDFITCIDHRGFVGKINTFGDPGSSILTVSISNQDISNISLGDIVLGGGIQENTIITRISTSPNKRFFLSKPLIDFQSGSTYIYKSKGLYNESLKAYCTNVKSAPTALQANVGASALTLAYVDDLSVGMVVQFGTKIPNNTIIMGIDNENKVISLSKSITDVIPFGQLITFAPAGTTENKEICFPPLDTSPPFIATPEGLRTTETRKNVRITPTSGQGEIKFVGLSSGESTVESLQSSSPSFTRLLRIKDSKENSYDILATLG
jgi:hypothetical protein